MPIGALSVLPLSTSEVSGSEKYKYAVGFFLTIHGLKIYGLLLQVE